MIDPPLHVDVGPSTAASNAKVQLPNQPAEPSSETSKNKPPVEDDPEHHMCRVCRSEEGSLYYPCLCTGSIKYVHQECLMEWLKYSKKEVCELCNYKYSFQPIYRPDMPKALPFVEILTGIALGVGRVFKQWLIYTLVIACWIGLVPITAARVYQAVFSADIHNIIYLPLHIVSGENLAVDMLKGVILLFVFVCSFISLVWLREQIVHGGPRDWLHIEGDEHIGDDGLHAEPEAPGDDELPNEFPDDPLDEPLHAERVENDVEYEEDSDEGDTDGENDDEDGHGEQDHEDVAQAHAQGEQEGNEEVHDHDNNANEGNQENADANADEGWRDWDRLGDGLDLTWQRLVGLDGSFVFLEHVFWVISLNTIFTVLFAFSPFKLGVWILNTLAIRHKIVFFPSLAAILTGYLALALSMFVFHRICGFLRIKSLYRLLGIAVLVFKVFFLVLIEIGFFPIICGWWMDLCSLPLFSATLSARIASFSAAPASLLFLHWMIGMIYVFYSASFVLLLREVLRPGVLWFMRNLNDPEFNPIQEMIELPVGIHLRRLVASTSLFFSAIFLIVYLPLRIIQSLTTSILPYNVSLSAETPLSELSLELLILQVVLPALLEQTSARGVLKTMVRTWCVYVGRLLKLERYLLSDGGAPPPAPNNNNMGENQRVNADGHNDGEAGRVVAALDLDPALAGGGLAAEHHALLLLREPRTFEPYVRPSYFPLRIAALVAALSVTSTICSCVAFIVPVSIGRFLIYCLIGHKSVHELYTLGMGLYTCWSISKVAYVIYSWLDRGGAHLREMFWSSAVLAFRVVVAMIPVVVIIPFLVGLCFHLVVVSPLRVGLQQTPLFFPWQEWAMGVLQLKIFLAAVMMGPEWWLKAALEQVYQDGVHGLRLRYIYEGIVIPVLMALLMQIAVPYAIANLIVIYWDPTLEELVVLLRFCYPFALFVVAVVSFVTWQMKKLRTLAENIRNEKYLVGTRLVNYERTKETEMEKEREKEKEKAKSADSAKESVAESGSASTVNNDASTSDGVEVPVEDPEPASSGNSVNLEIPEMEREVIVQ